MAVPAILGLPSVYAAWRNNRDMDVWREEIYAASDIEGAELVEQGSRFGVQPMTNGNHCDREVWLVYQTDRGAATIQEHFDSVDWSTPADFDGPLYSRPRADLVRVDFLVRFDSGRDVRCM